MVGFPEHEISQCLMTSQDAMDFWKKKWDTGQTHWHLPDLNQKLVKYSKLLFNGRKDGTVFIPLCGKSVDMRWLYDQGYRVMGVDCCDAPIKGFFEDHSLLCQKIDIDIGTIFQTPDERLKIYCCDILKLTKDICGPVTAIWDRGSLVAVDKEFRKPYAALIKSLVAPDFRYLLDVLHYDDWFVSGPPRSIPPLLVQNLFGDEFDIKNLEQRDITEGYEKRFGVKPIHNNIYLLTIKRTAHNV